MAANTICHSTVRAMGCPESSDLSSAPLGRLIGSMRRDCLDHVIVFGEPHLRHLLRSYEQYYNQYYNEVRAHLSLKKTRRFRATSSGEGAP
jgi:hypothetical protein